MSRSSATPAELRNGKRRSTRAAAIGVVSTLLVLQLAGIRSANAAVSPPAQITALESPSSETFDTLDLLSTPTGWGFEESGVNANSALTADNGSSSTGDTYSYGSASTTERAFGTLRSASVQSTLNAAYSNATGQTITSVTLGYAGEQWRLGQIDRPDRLDFSYSTDGTAYVDVDALDFSSPLTTGTVGAKDGNVVRTIVGAEISGLSIPAAGTLFMRWSEFDATGSDDGLAVDDFSIVAHSGGGGGGASCGASEIPAPQTTQCTSANVLQAPGELSIALEFASVQFGDITAGETSAAAFVGDVFYTNTLNNGQVWSSTVAATSLTGGGGVIGFDGMAFTPGETVTPSGPVPGASGTFTGIDTTPGATYSDPLTLVTAQATDQGSFTHLDSTATLSVPSGVSAGTYSGTLQYTITG
jgi:hypothetical protein